MLASDRERRICVKYSKRDAKGLVHCSECPLAINEYHYDFRCKSNSHYNRHTRQWEEDDYEQTD